MSPLAVAPGIWRITVPLPYRPRTVHAYLLDAPGGRLALVDGGANTDDAWAALDAGVRAVRGGWSAVELHVVTHMHMDHIGLARRVKDASGAPLAMGRLDAERAAHAAAHPEEEARYRENLLTEAGAAPDLVARAAAVGTADAATSGYVECDHPLPELTAPLPGLGEWRAVWTPGHTAGHISLHRPRDRVLVGGDAILPRITPTIGVNRQRPDPVGDYLGTIERVEMLHVELVLPGHGEPLRDPPQRLTELRSDALAESERVLQLLGSEKRTAAEIAAARYHGRSLPPAQRVQAIRETLAHLHHLIAIEKVASGQDAGVVRFWHL